MLKMCRVSRRLEGPKIAESSVGFIVVAEHEMSGSGRSKTYRVSDDGEGGTNERANERGRD